MIPANWSSVENAIAAWVFAGSGLATGQVAWARQVGKRPPSPPWISMRIIALPPHGIDYADYNENFLSLSDDVIESVDAGADTMTLTAHAYETGDGPVQLTTTGTLPAGLALATDYWLEVVDPNTVKVAATFPDAMNGVAIDITDAGAGTHTISATATTRRSTEEVTATVRGSRIATLSLQCFGGDALGSSSPLAILDAVGAAAALPDVAAALHAANIGVLSIGGASEIDGLVGRALFEPRAVAQHRLHLPLELAAAAPSSVIEYVEVRNADFAQSRWIPEDPN